MNKYQVTVEFVIKAEARDEAWQKARAYIEANLRHDLATVTAVSQPLPNPQEWIAINEPIRKQS